MTVTGDAGTGGFKVYELFSKHDRDGFYFSFFMLPIWSSVRARHQRGLDGGWVTAYHRLHFGLIGLFCRGILILVRAIPCVGHLSHQSITAESLGPIPMGWNLAISRAGAMFHAAANVSSVCSGCCVSDV